MTDLRSSISGLPTNLKLTDEELITAVHFMASIEHEVSLLDTQLIETNINHLTAKCLDEIMDEERGHIEKIQKLLQEFAHFEKKYDAIGANGIAGEFKPDR
jgi:hypothetical protein